MNHFLTTLHIVVGDDWKEIAMHNELWRKLLSAWVQFATQHNISWYLVAGTLLGTPTPNSPTAVSS